MITPVTTDLRACDIRPGVIAAVMELTEPALWEPAPGETPDECTAREAARADIVDDLLTEIASSSGESAAPAWPLLSAEGWAA